MLLFQAACLLVPNKILGIYTKDSDMIAAAVPYFLVIAVSFLPMTLTLQFSALLRSMEKSRIPLYAGIVSMMLNIVFNYLFIFGKLGIPPMGLLGAGLGTLIARTAESMMLLIILLKMRTKGEILLHPVSILGIEQYKKISYICQNILSLV